MTHEPLQATANNPLSAILKAQTLITNVSLGGRETVHITLDIRQSIDNVEAGASDFLPTLVWEEGDALGVLPCIREMKSNLFWVLWNMSHL